MSKTEDLFSGGWRIIPRFLASHHELKFVAFQDFLLTVQPALMLNELVAQCHVVRNMIGVGDDVDVVVDDDNYKTHLDVPGS